MFSAIRKRFTYANVAVTVALVFAMSGGAYAARKYIITSTKQIKPSVLKQIAGKPGPAGTEGKMGPAGPQGPAGANGKEGPLGKEGTAGKEGPLGPLGKEGKLGPLGPQGEPGEPWTPNSQLPSKATEKGTWAAAGVPGKLESGEEGIYASISFTIPLKEGLHGGFTPEAENHVHVIPKLGKGEGKFETGVTGKDGLYTGCPTTSSNGKPEAEPGNLCIFVNSLTNVEFRAFTNTLAIFPQDPEGKQIGAFESGATGTVIEIVPEVAKEFLSARGTWAVAAK